MEKKKEVIYVSLDQGERFQLNDVGKADFGFFKCYWIECWGVDEDFQFLKDQFLSVDFESMSISLKKGITLDFEIDEDPFEG